MITKIEMNYTFGYTGTYIKDYDFEHLTNIPMEAAVEWVKKKCPDISMGNGVLAKDLTINENSKTGANKNGWLNKLFILVENDHDKWLALVNWDGKFSIYIEK